MLSGSLVFGCHDMAVRGGQRHTPKGFQNRGMD